MGGQTCKVVVIVFFFISNISKHSILIWNLVYHSFTLKQDFKLNLLWKGWNGAFWKYDILGERKQRSLMWNMKKQNNSASAKWDFLLKISQPAFEAECAPEIHSPVSKGVILWTAGNWSILAPWTCTARFWYVYAAVKQVKPTQPNQTQPTPIQIKPTKTKTNNSKHTKEPKYHNFYQLIRAGSCTFWGPQRELPRMVKGRSFPTNSLSHCWALVVAYGDRATETYIFTFWSLK